MQDNKKETIIILTHVQLDNSYYCGFVHNHAKALVDLGYNVIVISPTTYKFSKKYWKIVRGKTKGVKYYDGVEVHYLKRIGVSNILSKSKFNINGMLYYFAIRRLVNKIIKEHNVKYIDAHMFKIEGYAAKKLKKKYKLSVLLTLHGTSFMKNLTFKNGINDIINTSKIIDRFICVSNKIAKELKKLDISNYNVIYNGINYYESYNKNSNKRKNSIVSVGTLIPRKKFDLTIKIFYNIQKKHPDATLTIVGEGPMEENLKKIVEELGIKDRVTFYKRLANDKVYDILRENSIFLMPSIDEGFGIVYAEAMYNKCITIGTTNEGIDGFIEHGINGFLADSDEKKITKLMLDILNEKYDLELIRKNANKSAEKLNWNKNAVDYIKVVEEIEND